MENRHTGATKSLVRCVKKPTPSAILHNADAQEITIVSAVMPVRADTSGMSCAAGMKSVRSHVTKQGPDLRAPAINSSTILRQQMGELRENMPKKSTCSAEGYLPSMSEMITKHVNFPQDKAVFKNLIPLNSLKYKGDCSAPSRSDVVCPNDREPHLGKYVMGTPKSEYSLSMQLPSALDKTTKGYIGNRHYLWNQRLNE